MRADVNVLLTGVTGNLGAYTARRLLKTGANVYALARERKVDAHKRCIRCLQTFGAFSEEEKESVESRFHVLTADITDWRSLAELELPTLHETWHFASTLKFLPRDREEIYSVNLGALKNVLDIHKKYSTEQSRFFYISTAYLGGASVTKVTEEHIPYSEDLQFHNDYERSKLEAENFIHWEMISGFVRGAILRPSIVIGEKASKRLVNYHGYYMGVDVAVKLKKHFDTLGDSSQNLRVRAAPDAALNLIPIDDAVGLMMAVRKKHFESGAIFNIVNGNEVTLAQTLEVLSDELGIEITPCSPEDFDKGKKTKYEKVLSYGMTYTLPYLNQRMEFDTKKLTTLLKDEYRQPVYPDLIRDLTAHYIQIVT